MDSAVHDYPRFAVVGHPNKGKSSIVASLSWDDSVQISDTPGTTIKTRSFPLKVDGRVLYELYDTPGFQRAREVLEWLRAQNVSVAKRPDAVRAFVREHRGDPRFADEVELLGPIIDGAVIVYVVDGSKPYGDEYEAEMEILRWSGQPSMALINQIGTTDYTDEWKGVLGQYFKLIRRYDPMKRSFEDHISLLEGIAHLREEWIGPLKESIEAFKSYREGLIEQTARIVAGLAHKSIAHIERISCGNDCADDQLRLKLERRYRETVRDLESKAHQEIARIWSHGRLEADMGSLELDGIDLFSRQSASIFGLTRKEMIYTGMAGGAAAGAGVDLLFAGHTLLLGGLIGAAVGGVGAYIGFDELSEVRVLGARLGSQHLEIGPMANRNFPYILLGRALWYAQEIASRSHALRGRADMRMDESFRERWLDERMQKELEKWHKKFRSDQSIEPLEFEEYVKLVEGALKNILI